MKYSLIKIFLKLDYRNREDKGFKRIIGLLVSYLIGNSALAFTNLYGVDKYTFMFLSYTMCIMFMMFTVINDFPYVFFPESQISPLKKFPLRESDIVKAKFISSYFYLLFIPAVFSVPYAVAYIFFNESFFSVVIYSFSLILFSFLFSVIVLLFYGIAVLKLGKRSKIIVYLLQFSFFIFIFYLSSSGKRLTSSGSIMSHKSVVYFPQYYFVLSVENLLLMVFMVFLILLILGITYFYYRDKYFETLRIVNEVITKKESFLGKRKKSNSFFNLTWLTSFEKLILKNKISMSFYILLKNHLKNSSALKMRIIPLMLMPYAMILAAVVFKIDNLLFIQPGKIFLDKGIMIISPSIVIIVLLFLRIVIGNTKFALEDSVNLSWIYRNLPFDSKKEILSGINMFFYIYFLFPVITVLYIVESFYMPTDVVFFNILIIVSFLYFVNTMFALTDKKLPFTVAYSNINSAGKFLEMLIIIIFSIVFFVIQIFTIINYVYLTIVAFLLLITAFLSDKYYSGKRNKHLFKEI